MNGKVLLHTSVLSVGILVWAATAAAQEYTYESGYLRHVDGLVSVQRAQNPEPEAGEVNLPVLPGDRVWTGTEALAEVRFVDGALVRLEASTKVDFMAFGAEPNIRLWNGSIAVDADDDAARIRVDTPSGSVFPQTAGTYRIDVTDGVTTTVFVADGVAELASEHGSVLVGTGQSASLEPGAAPSEPLALDSTRTDELASFGGERRDPELRTVPLAELPTEVHTYVEELDGYGTWRDDATYGAVWYPTNVGAGWAPYRNGRWCYTSYGYTWVAAEPWGWAPHHYGRWGYNHYGWYWVPGRYWSPAWVSVAVGPFWVGWSPLGYHGGPVFSYGHSFYGGGRYPHYRQRYPYRYGRQGKAVPRHVYDHGAGWNYSRKEGFGRRGKARLRASDVRSSASSARVQNQGAVFDRRLEPHALGRNNALAKRGPLVAPFSTRGAVGTRVATRGRAVSRTRGSDRGLQRSLSAMDPSSRARTRTGSTTHPSPPRGFRSTGGSPSRTGDRSRATGARSRERQSPQRSQPSRTFPTRTTERTRSRTFQAPATQPERESTGRSVGRRAVTRSEQRQERTTTRGRSTEDRSRSRSTHVTRTPPRSQPSARSPSRARGSRGGRAGVQRSTPRTGRGASGVQGSGGGNRGGMRSRGGASRSRGESSGATRGGGRGRGGRR